MLPRRPRSLDRSRHGSIATEALLTLPLLLLLLAGLVGLADLLISEQMLAEASGRAVRAAALGKSDDEIIDAVRSVLGEERTASATICVRPIDGDYGDPVQPGQLVEVRVELAARSATATPLALVDPDEILFGRSVMQKE